MPTECIIHCIDSKFPEIWIWALMELTSGDRRPSFGGLGTVGVCEGVLGLWWNTLASNSSCCCFCRLASSCTTPERLQSPDGCALSCLASLLAENSPLCP